MGRLNHQRPILQLMDAKKRGFQVEGISSSALGKRYLTPGSPSPQTSSKSRERSGKEPSEREKIHRVAVAIVDRFIAMGDCRDADLLLGFVGIGPDRDALRQWFLTYGGMRIKSGTGNFAKANLNPPSRTVGLATPYWTFKAPPKKKAFRLDSEMSAFISKVRKRKHEKVPGDDIPDGLLRELETLLRRHGIGFD